jgi:hypothetical protein
MKKKQTEWTILKLLLAFGLIFMLGTAHASTTCMGLICNGNPRYDVRQIASDRIVHHASVRQVLENPSGFNGAAVRITGQITAIEQRLSRNGSFYLVLTVTDPNVMEDGDHSLTVFSFLPPKFKMGDTVVVEGTYRVDYWFAGWPSENFIDAENIRRGSSL